MIPLGRRYTVLLFCFLLIAVFLKVGAVDAHPVLLFSTTCLVPMCVTDEDDDNVQVVKKQSRKTHRTEH